DPQPARLLVELVVGAPLRTGGAGAEPAAAAGGDVGAREAGARLRPPAPGALLVHGPRRDLLREALGPALPALALLDVLVLACELRPLLHSPGRHRHPPAWLTRVSSRSRGRRRQTPCGSASCATKPTSRRSRRSTSPAESRATAHAPRRPRRSATSGTSQIRYCGESTFPSATNAQTDAAA